MQKQDQRASGAEVDIFKAHPCSKDILPITAEKYYEATKNDWPYVQLTSSGRKYFALCPLCDNPIHMVNLFDAQDAKTKPYGAHNKRNVAGLCDFDEEAYLSCDLARPGYRGAQTKRKPDSETALAIKQEMRESFDRIIYIFEHACGIHLGQDAAHDALIGWSRSNGWRNLEANYYNLPFMLFYGVSSSLLGRWVVKGSELDVKLSKRRDLRRSAADARYDKRRAYVRFLWKDAGERAPLRFSLYKRISTVKDEHWYEHFYLGISKGQDTILRLKIPVDHGYLQRLKNLPPERQHRNQKLLEIAERILT